MAKKKTTKKAAKKTAKKGAKKGAKGGGKDPLVVASKVKTYIRSKSMMCSSDAVEAMSNMLYCVLDKAIARAQENRRSTVRPQDL